MVCIDLTSLSNLSLRSCGPKIITTGIQGTEAKKNIMLGTIISNKMKPNQMMKRHYIIYVDLFKQTNPTYKL